jgi:uncharacterized membrane protein
MGTASGSVLALAAILLVLTALALAAGLVGVVGLARVRQARLRLSVTRTWFALMPPPEVATSPGLAIHVINCGRQPVDLRGWVVLLLTDGSTVALSDPSRYEGRVWGVPLVPGQGWSVVYPRVWWQRERTAGREAWIGIQVAEASGTAWRVRLRRDLAVRFNEGS